MHVDGFTFVILRCSAFDVLPVAVGLTSLLSIVSKLLSIELSHTEFRYLRYRLLNIHFW